MYNTEGVDAVATITELRADTAALIEYAKKTRNGILIQKNNRPFAVLLSWDTYIEIKERTDVDLL